MPTPTVENYVKAIYELQRPVLRADGGSRDASGGPDELVQLGRLASRLGVVPGTVTTMIRTLSDAHLVEYEPRVGVRLTPEGEKLALHVLRRHRVVESFLVDVLGLDWSEVHDEAEELEHVVSEKVLDRMDALLGRPRVDPHGDPIPDVHGRMHEPRSRPLPSYSAGDDVTITRVENRDAEFLRFLDASKLTPGTTLRLVRVDAQAGTVTVRVNAARSVVSLSLSAAGKVLAARAE